MVLAPIKASLVHILLTWSLFLCCFAVGAVHCQPVLSYVIIWNSICGLSILFGTSFVIRYSSCLLFKVILYSTFVLSSVKRG